MVVVLAQLDFNSVAIMHAAIDLARIMAKQTRAEDGCLHYAYATDVSVPARIQLSELWRDDSCLAAHLHSAHLGTFRNALRKLGGVRSSVKRYDVRTVADLALPPLENG